ncbi:MAG: ParB N-terminal domain-containing protein, partial [Desulfobacterota bacterium]|nr:ParB N-terminal domain-containing protein [Thermodesulfobacteriota bacterium]
PMTYLPDLNLLTHSMKKTGLINPVLLWKNKERISIVSGYRRVLVAKLLGWEKIRAKLYYPEEINSCDGFLLTFYENLGTRRFNLIEAAMVITGFQKQCGWGEKQIQEEILPLLGLHPGRKVLLALQSLLNLTEEGKEFIVKNNISLFNAAKMATFSPPEQNFFYPWLTKLKLGENKMRECLEMIEEIVKRDGISVERLFSFPSFTALLFSGELNISEKTEQFRKALRAIRYPEFTQLQEEFQKHKKKLSLPPEISILPPEYFEGDKLRLSFECKSLDDFRIVLKKLEDIADQEDFKKLFDLL